MAGAPQPRGEPLPSRWGECEEYQTAERFSCAVRQLQLQIHLSKPKNPYAHRKDEARSTAGLKVTN